MPGEIPHFGLYHDEPILPPSEQRESMTVEKLQEKYPLRYKLYCQEGDETEPVETISPEVIVRRLQMLNNLDRYITAHGGVRRGRVLREKQLAVFRDTRDFLETGETEGYVEAPTGFGKTVLFSEVIRATGQRTLVVVPSRILVEQTYQRFRQFNPNLDVGRYYSDRKEREKQVTVTTYQSLVISCGGVRPEDIDLLILDEVHQSLTDARIEAVGRFTNPVKLGFTATPEYSRDKRVENLLNNQIHTVSLREAVETGLLCSFSVFLAETDVDLSNVSVDQDGDYNDRELEAAINIYSRNKSAVELYQRLNEEHSGLSKAVTYCVSIAHAREVARVFNEAGIPAAAIWSDQDKDERRRVLEAYGRGEIKVLTNVNVLTEGFDDPQAALCLNLRPTLSKVVAKQRGGRVLRLDPDNPKKHAVVVDYLDRNENKRTTQVTFAQVAEGSQIVNPVPIDTGGTDVNGDENGHEDKVLIDKEPFDLEGLHVITNSQEVLRVVSELETSNFERVTDEDFLITQKILLSLFVGHSIKLMQAVSEIITEIAASDPSIFVQKLNAANKVVWTTRQPQLLIEFMQKKGIVLKDESADPLLVQPFDFPLTQNALLPVFVGDARRLKEAAAIAVNKIKTENPELCAIRRSGVQSVPVVTDRERFISEMLALGVFLKDEDLPQVEEGDFTLSIRSFKKLFRGPVADALSLAKQLLPDLLNIGNHVAVQKRAGNMPVIVITDPELLLKLMVEKGAQLLPQQVQGGEFVISNNTFMEVFVGEYKTLLPIAESVIDRIRQVEPHLIVERMSGKNYVQAVTDRERFIQEMVNAGVHLKDTGILPRQKTDFLLEAGYCIECFRGTWREGGILKTAYDKVLQEARMSYPEKFTRRKNGTKIVEAFTDRDIFIKLMVDSGVLIKENTSVTAPGITSRVRDSDFLLGYNSYSKVFQGGHRPDSRLTKLANEVVANLRVTHPDKFVVRQSGVHRVEVFTDRSLFIESMLGAGAKLK